MFNLILFIGGIIMSSFILDKKEFIKAAGIMCGIEESKRDKHKYLIGRTMKRTFNYLVCSLALFVAIVFVLSGSLLWTLCGLAWCLMLYISGVAWPKWWKMFWVSNLRILSHFNCL